jgi:integrase
MSNTTKEDVEAVRDRIRNPDPAVEGIDPEEYAQDRDLLIEFSKKMAPYRTKWGYERQEGLLKRLIMISWGGTDERGYTEEEMHDSSLSAALEDREAAEEIVEWIYDNYTNSAEANRDMRDSFRMFGKVLTNDDPTDKEATPPPSIDWVSSKLPDNHNPVPSREDMITWNEVREMCEHPETNARNAALLALQWDAGLRSGELQDLQVGDISDHHLGKTVHADGKTGQRDVTITNAVEYVRKWLNSHPAPDDPSAPLWSKLKKAEGISYRMFRNIFADAADRIDLEKPDTPTNFRKSSASFFASKGWTSSHLERRFGWVQGSSSPRHYIRIFDDEADHELARARGMDIDWEPEEEQAGPTDCKRCGVLINAETDKCDNCGFIQDRKKAMEAVNPGGSELIEKIRDVVQEEIEQHELGPDPRVSEMGELKDAAEIRENFDTNPAAPVNLEELAERAETED